MDKTVYVESKQVYRSLYLIALSSHVELPRVQSHR
jgi:hypothetical protein